jgi:hypothetical protein
MKTFFTTTTAVAALALVAGIAMAAPPLVGGEGAGETPVLKSITMSGGVVSLSFEGVYGTDVNRGLATKSPVPDGTIICLKANGQQSRDWKGKVQLGSIVMDEGTCSVGRGIVKGGKVTVTVNACAGRTEGTFAFSGVVEQPDKLQGFVPHFGQYQEFTLPGPKQKDLSAFSFYCADNRITIAGLSNEQKKLVTDDTQ